MCHGLFVEALGVTPVVTVSSKLPKMSIRHVWICIRPDCSLRKRSRKQHQREKEDLQ